MKIALLTQYYKPEMGAPQNRLYEMVTGLAENGCDLRVVTAMPNYPTGKIFEPYRHRFSITEKLDGIEVRRYWLYPSNSKHALPRIFSMLSFAFSSLFAWRSLRGQKIDFLIVESPPLLVALSGYILAKLSGARLISNISDVWPLSAKEMGAISDGLLYRFLERIERFVYKKSLFCMGQSSEIVEHLKKSGCRETYLFRNGVNPARFAENNSPKPLPHDQPLTIVYAGLLGFAQGIYDLCKAIDFNQLGVEFHIYGAGGEQEALSGFVEEHPHRGIFFHGAVSADEIPAVLSRAHVTLIPLALNIFGAVPSKIYESMAAGVPILFSGDGEGGRIVNHEKVGWVSPPADYEALKRNIAYIRENPQEVLEKREHCRQVAQNKYNRPRQIKDLTRFIESFL